MTTQSDSLVSVQFYMRLRGWIEEPPGPSGSWWHKPSRLSSEEAYIGVPDRIVPGTIEWRSVIERLAEYERRSFDEIAETIRDQFIDVTELSIASDFMIARSIPLSAGAHLLSSAKVMVRAAATAAMRPRAEIAGKFSTVANRIADQSRLGHTREGSYVIPLLMPLTPKDQLERVPLTGMETQRVEYEPGERRVIRTLAQALNAVHRRIVEPAKEPTARDVVPLVDAGVTRELVIAVHSVLTQPEVSDFKAAFQWAGAVSPPGGVPRMVELPAEAGPLLESAQRLLKSSRRESAQIVTGPIVEIRQLPDAPTGAIAIQTMRYGKMSEVRVELPASQLEAAHAWMTQRRAVVAEGQLVRERGRPLRILDPRRVHPLDEMFLF